MKEILVCNCGSSSLKIDVFRLDPASRTPSNSNAGLTVIADATAERLGSDEAGFRIRFYNDGENSGGDDRTPAEERVAVAGLKHQSALQKISEIFAQRGVFPPEHRLGVGHRVVHGGPFIKAPVLLDDENIAIIERCAEFAPLHNPANLTGIRECAHLFGVPQVGVFDTAFHATIPPEAHTYALPRAIAEKHGLRRYGFHGTSHEYCAQVIAERLQAGAKGETDESGDSRNKLKLITMHLGNGASVCAIRGGRSIDTSMGFTPLEGLVMGTRSGDLDPAMIEVLIEKEGLSIDEVGRMLNKASGLKGICGHSDMRDILAARAGDDAGQAATAGLALDVFCYRAKKYLGAYMAALGGAVDAIAFTAGIGENAAIVREKILSGLDAGAGIALDPAKNESPPPDGEIQAANSKTRVFVIPADEELAIARKTLGLVAG
ncbi:MAG: acetate kinase [bacterium]|nr:acetate kinase [bacterium]